MPTATALRSSLPLSSGNLWALRWSGSRPAAKGYSQILFDLPDGSAIGLSTARYYTGKGVSLIGTGLTPDTEVTLSEEDQQRLLAGELTPAEDAQFQAAVAALGLS